MKKIITTLLVLFFITLADTFFTLKAEDVNIKTSIETKKDYYIKVPTYSEDVIYTNVRGTVYHPVQEQTDDTPLITADNSFIDTTRINELRWVAVSRDILKRKFKDREGNVIVWSGKLKLGDTVWVDYDTLKLKKMSIDRKGNFSQNKYDKLIKKHELIKGYWVIKDVMGPYYHAKDSTGVKRKVMITNSIDFLQHPKTGFLHMWDRSIIITKRKITGHEIVRNNNKTSENSRKINDI